MYIVVVGSGSIVLTSLWASLLFTPLESNKNIMDELVSSNESEAFPSDLPSAFPSFSF